MNNLSEIINSLCSVHAITVIQLGLRMSDVISHMPHEEDAVVDAGGQFFLVVGHHDEGFIATAAEGLDDIFNQATVAVVKTMEWFVEDKELRVLDKCPCHKNQALLTA